MLVPALIRREILVPAVVTTEQTMLSGYFDELLRLSYMYELSAVAQERLGKGNYDGHPLGMRIHVRSTSCQALFIEWLSHRGVCILQASGKRRAHEKCEPTAISLMMIDLRLQTRMASISG